MTSTDAYKLAMSHAGFPLRRETFYFSFREGGWQYIPFDLRRCVGDVLDSVTFALSDNSLVADDASCAFRVTETMRQMSPADVTVDCVPPGSWVHAREPILSVTGPSFLVSVIEPLISQLFYRIQVATSIKRGTVERFEPTCATQAGTVLEIADLISRNVVVDVQTEEYRAKVKEAATALVRKVDASRIVEVGLRSATCVEEHQIAVETMSAVGIKTTSATHYRGMQVAGSMGHEHVQRLGDDLTAFRALRDRMATKPCYLLDTYDTISSGVPAAIIASTESGRACSVRYDSGRKLENFAHTEGRFQDAGLEAPVHVISGNVVPSEIDRFEDMRRLLGVEESRVVYSLGGYLVNGGRTRFMRSEVGATYNLSMTNGRPTMKFGDVLGKQSIPGRPVVWRRMRGDGPQGVIAQEGEQPAEGYAVLTNNPDVARDANQYHSFNPETDADLALSPETNELIEQQETECLL
jgi:nicotinic acid phosphoribosyltransferase